jgi:hypothetical protein
MPLDSLTVPVSADLRDLVSEEAHVYGANFGPEGQLWTVWVQGPPRWAAHRARSWQSIKVTVVVIDAAGEARCLDLPDADLFVAHVQPLPGGRLLRVAKECWEYVDETPEHNAEIVHPDGSVTRHVLGHDVRMLQTMRDGQVWAGYGDEGVFRKEDNFGVTGLVGWSSEIKRCHQLDLGSLGLGTQTERSLLRWPSDVWAADVHEEDVYICCYPGRELLRLRQGRLQDYWLRAQRLVGALTVTEDVAWMEETDASTDAPVRMRSYHLGDVHQLEPRGEVELAFLGRTLRWSHVHGRCEGLLRARQGVFAVIRDRQVGWFTVEDLETALGASAV